MFGRRKPKRYAPMRPPTDDELRARAAEEDRVCALFGPDCQSVEYVSFTTGPVDDDVRERFERTQASLREAGYIINGLLRTEPHQK